MRFMAGYLSNVWDGTLQELAVDYVRCFIGGGMDAFSAAYPYESVYTSPKRLMMQEARDEVLAIYRSQGFDKAEGWKESEDHVAAAYPYESVYTSPKRLMMQEARDEVLAIYRSQGFDKAEGWKESEDHVAAEFVFMAAMARRTAEACREGDEDRVASLLTVQLNFLSDHLYAWTGMMTSDMRGYARTDFYKGLAAYVDGFLTSDRELLMTVLGVEPEA